MTYGRLSRFQQHATLSGEHFPAQLPPPMMTMQEMQTMLEDFLRRTGCLQVRSLQGCLAIQHCRANQSMDIWTAAIPQECCA